MAGNGNASRGIGAFCLAMATAGVTEHFAFGPWETVAVAFFVGVGSFFLTASAV